MEILAEIRTLGWVRTYEVQRHGSGDIAKFGKRREMLEFLVKLARNGENGDSQERMKLPESDEGHQFKNLSWGTSLVVQGLRILLPTWGIQVGFLVQEDAKCHGATKPAHHHH